MDTLGEAADLELNVDVDHSLPWWPNVCTLATFSPSPRLW